MAAMTAAQTRMADTLESFYGSTDKTSEGAMAGHAYKRSVDDLDGVVGRELVRDSVHSVMDHRLKKAEGNRINRTEQPFRSR